MTKLDNFSSVKIIADGVEFNVWRELNTFITWGHMMSADAIRYTESNVISYRDTEYFLDYDNRKITIDPKDEGDVPDSLVEILKQVANGAINHNKMVSSSNRLN